MTGYQSDQNLKKSWAESAKRSISEESWRAIAHNEAKLVDEGSLGKNYHDSDMPILRNDFARTRNPVTARSPMQKMHRKHQGSISHYSPHTISHTTRSSRSYCQNTVSEAPPLTFRFLPNFRRISGTNCPWQEGGRNLEGPTHFRKMRTLLIPYGLSSAREIAIMNTAERSSLGFQEFSCMVSSRNDVNFAHWIPLVRKNHRTDCTSCFSCLRGRDGFWSGNEPHWTTRAFQISHVSVDD